MIRAISLGALLALLTLPSPSSAGMAAEASPLVADSRASAPQNDAVFGVARLGDSLSGVVVYFAAPLPPGPKEGTLMIATANGEQASFPVVVGAKQKSIPATAPTINGQAPAAAYTLIPQPAMQALPASHWALQAAVVQVPALPAAAISSSPASTSSETKQTLPTYRLCSKAGLSHLRLQTSPAWEATLPATAAEASLSPCP